MAGSSISVTECVTGTALICNPCKMEYHQLIGKAISKLFFMHGKTYHENSILNFLESLIDTYNHETPQTILLFLKKAANGDFGKFYGEPDIGTIREWFSDFLQTSIIPARERAQGEHKEVYDNQREQGESLGELIKRSGKHTPTTKESDFGKGKIRHL